jgi:hypothetical protein
MSTRREFISLLSGAVALPFAGARAQRLDIPVIGLLSSLSRGDAHFVMPAFHRGLREADLAEGRTVAIEYRWAAGQYEQLPGLAEQLVKRRVAVLAAISGTPAALAAKGATTTIPIVSELAVMQGARLVTCSETERGRRWAESRIKEMSGGDPITARYMNGNPFNFLPTFKIMISGNYKPSLRPDSAMRRRFQLVPFQHKIPEHEVDKNLKKKMEQEWGAILGWMIEGCRLWQRDGLQPPAAVVAATDEYMVEEAEDCLAMWLADCCEAEADVMTKHGDLYYSYNRYAERAGEKQPLTSVQLGKELSTLEFGKKRTKAGRFVIGLRLQVPVPPPMPGR